jgi:hypothetical protein
LTQRQHSEILGTAVSGWTLPLILTAPKNILIAFLIVLIILTFLATLLHTLLVLELWQIEKEVLKCFCKNGLDAKLVIILSGLYKFQYKTSLAPVSSCPKIDIFNLLGKKPGRAP